MIATLEPVGLDPEPTWEPEAGCGLRSRRDRRKKATCEVCGRAIWGDGRLCRGPVNDAAPAGCAFWEYTHRFRHRRRV